MTTQTLTTIIPQYPAQQSQHQYETSIRHTSARQPAVQWTNYDDTKRTTVGYDDTKRTNETRRVTWDYNYDVGLLCLGALAPLDAQPLRRRLKRFKGLEGKVLKGNFVKRLQVLVQGGRNMDRFLLIALGFDRVTRAWGY